jgi:hypothetical protein
MHLFRDGEQGWLVFFKKNTGHNEDTPEHSTTKKVSFLSRVRPLADTAQLGRKVFILP